MKPFQPPTDSKCLGFTLLETLIVLTIGSVLVVLTATTIRFARQNAKGSISLSNLRSHSQAIQMYVGDYNDTYPFFTTPGFETGEVHGGGLDFPRISFFDAHRVWHIALSDAYFDSNARSKIFSPPDFVRLDGTNWPFYTPYLYACSFIAEPKYWNELTRTGPEQFGPTRASQVRYPSMKSLVIESWPYTATADNSNQLPSIPLRIANCDGSAKALSIFQRFNGYEKGDGFIFANDGAIHYTDQPPLLHTIDGVLGRDTR